MDIVCAPLYITPNIISYKIQLKQQITNKMETVDILKKFCKQNYGSEIVIKTYSIQEVKKITEFTKQKLKHE